MRQVDTYWKVLSRHNLLYALIIISDSASLLHALRLGQAKANIVRTLRQIGMLYVDMLQRPSDC
jgi:hypothetical protein